MRIETIEDIRAFALAYAKDFIDRLEGLPDSVQDEAFRVVINNLDDSLRTFPVGGTTYLHRNISKVISITDRVG